MLGGGVCGADAGKGVGAADDGDGTDAAADGPCCPSGACTLLLAASSTFPAPSVSATRATVGATVCSSPIRDTGTVGKKVGTSVVCTSLTVGKAVEGAAVEGAAVEGAAVGTDVAGAADGNEVGARETEGDDDGRNDGVSVGTPVGRVVYDSTRLRRTKLQVDWRHIVKMRPIAL